MNRLLSILLVCLLQVSLALASTFNLKVEVTPDGSGSLNTSGGTYEEGSSVYLRTYNYTGFVFKGWYEGEKLLSSSTGFNYTMPANDAVVQARYEYNPGVPANPAMPDTATYYTLTASVSPIGAGSLNSSSGKYAAGASVYLRTYGNTGFQFVGWQNEKGVTVSSSTSFNYQMPSNDSKLTAIYTYDPSVPANPDSMATRYTVSLACKPAGSGSFNTSSATVQEGGSVHLYAYTNTGFQFQHWEDANGNVISSEQNFYYVMPHGNTKIYGVFEYNPSNPSNPGKNYWNKEMGEVIVDDFTPGSLSSAVSTAISGSNRSDVTMITVSGRMNNNDFGVANDYTNCTLLDLSRVTGVTEVPSYAFDYTNLETVYLPSTIEKIGYRAFAECKSLSALTCYAMTPPTLERDVFANIPEGLVVYVPAAAISQYQDNDTWGKFTLLPIQEDIRSISISLPDGANVQDYSQMWLELTNTRSGQRMHYVMTDRSMYTFANIIRNTTWNVSLRNERGDVFGEINNVEVKDEDVTVTFASLTKPQNVSLAVVTPDGTDVTSQVQVTWTDVQGNYVAQGASLTGLPIGYQANYRIVLPQELAMQYETPTAANYTLQDGDNALACQLTDYQKLQLTGKVKDASTGLPLSGAVVSASQTFGGKYSKTVSAKTDNNGTFTMEVSGVPTTVAVAAADYVSQTLDYSNNELAGLNEFAVPDVSLKSITGATISYGFTYTTVEGETQNWYSDYQNIGYTLYNVTREKPVSQFNVQYPQIVLLEDVEDGDVLRLTATSRTNAFKAVEATTTIDGQKAEATFAITEQGRIDASFAKTSNASVVGSLYDASGKLLKTYSYSDAKLSISDLADGSYTLVSMGSSRLFNSIYDLAQLPQTGLDEGADYVQNTVEVKSGAVSTISIDEVPTLDESKLYYTGDNTSFTVNKPSIVAGNYLTLTGRIDFKSAYASNVSNVQMIVDLPESCQFVENSVMVGNSTSSYTVNDHRITIPMARYTDRVRFCVIPTLGGEYAPSAFAQFDLNGETVTQPMGSANYTAKDLSISVPSTVAKTSVPISGMAIGASNVEIYDNGVLIGQTTSLANGTWATTCELNEPYNLSKHQIYAKVITKNSLELTSENASCVYDMNAIQVSVVKMYHDNPEMHKTYELTFDFLNPSNKEENYIYYIYNKKFTFTIDFTNNDTTKVSNVILYVKTAKSGWHPLEATYDAKQNKWIAAGEFGNMYDGDLPVNVSVDYQINSELVGDRNKCQDVLAEMESLLQDDYELTSMLYEYQKAIDNKNDSLIETLSGKINERLGLDLILTEDSLIQDLDNGNMDEIQMFLDSLQSYSNWYKDNSNVEISDNDGNLYYARWKSFSEVGLSIEDLANYTSCHLSDGSIIYFYSDEKGSIYIDPQNDLYLQVQIALNSTRTPIKKVLDLQNLERFVDYWSDKYGEFQNRVGPILEGIKTLQNLIDLKIVETEARIQQLEDFASLYERGRYWNMPKPAGYYRTHNLIHLAEKSLKNLTHASSVVGKFLKVFDVAGMLNDFATAISSIREWIDIIRTIESIDCPGMDALAKKARGYANAVAVGYGTTLGTNIGSLSTADKLSKTGVGLAITAGINDFSIIQSGLNQWNDIRWKAKIRLEIPNLKCDRPKPGGNSTGGAAPLPNGKGQQSNNPDKKFGIDPSGYVYEGVSSNRLDGVTATIFYKETVEDMYGDLHENIVKWDAAEYAQENPLFTDENGMYRWDVPQGLWQVKFEKEGYETTYSDWLPVPPPQLDVNIAMKQNVQPTVKMARAYEDAVEVEFDKYMMPELLTTDNISVMQNGTPVKGTVELLNEEVSYEGEAETFASKLRFNAAEPFTEQEITLMVSNRVKSYAGIRMQDDYQQTFTTEQEIKQIVSDSLTVVGYGEKATLTVSVLPASASKGKTLTVKTSSPMILDVETQQVVIGNDGKAEIIVSGELPGTAALTFSVDGTDKTALTIASVEQKTNMAVATPTASIASSSTVDKGTEIELSCATEGATIYYTLDGSCPCDNTAARKVYDGTPIVINETTTIKAMAVAADMTESEVAEFTYIISSTGVEEIAINGLVEIYPLPVRDKLNISAGGKTIQSVSITSTNGVLVASHNKSAKKVSLDVSNIPANVYIITIATDSGTFCRKILKVQ